MARVIAKLPFDQSGLDFNRLERFGIDAEFHDNINLSYRGKTYQDLIEVEWGAGASTAVSSFGGSGFQVTSHGDVTAGTVTGYLESYWNGFQYAEGFGIMDIRVSAASINHAVSTASRSDDFRILADLLSGDDLFSLSTGDDLARGLDGNDRMLGFGGDDTLAGGAGRDTVYGGAGDDRLLGGGERDVVAGGSGNDVIDGGGFSDRLFGSWGHDRIGGGGGDDLLVGGGGRDRLGGGFGDDTLIGGDGDDVLNGSRGADTFIFDARDGFDIILAFGFGEDLLQFRCAGSTADLEIEQAASSVDISFGRTTVRLAGLDLEDISASDFIF